MPEKKEIIHIDLEELEAKTISDQARTPDADRARGVDSISLRSEELQDVIGMIPHWIIRWGITILFSVILLLFTGSWIFRYPDVVPATIMITTKNPPATIVARISGKIQHLLVKENQVVGKGDYIAVLENTANLQHVLELKKKLAEFQSFVIDFSSGSQVSFSKNCQLGQLQSTYEIFLKGLSDYLHFVQINYFPRKIASVEGQLQKQKNYCDQMSGQIGLLEEECNMSKNQYDRADKLFSEGIISRTDLENARSAYLQKKNTLEAARANLIQARMQADRLEGEAMDLRKQNDDQQNQLRLALKQSYDNLRSAMLDWEYSYVIQSPIPGTVSFTSKFWSVNQNVTVGEKMVSIVPLEKTELVGRIGLPVQGSGKVKLGQKVRIKLANYPFMEFGIVWGQIRSKSLVPVDNVYVLDVVLPMELKTSYGKTLDFSQEMQGVAEIITENKRLIERFLQPFKSLFTQNRE